MKILVVEDDRKVAGFIEQGLREEGYAVDVAPDGDEATMLAHVYDYDLLLLDVMLPKKTGLQVAAELRREGRKTPILMLTARARAPRRRQPDGAPHLRTDRAGPFEAQGEGRRQEARSHPQGVPAARALPAAAGGGHPAHGPARESVGPALRSREQRRRRARRQSAAQVARSGRRGNGADGARRGIPSPGAGSGRGVNRSLRRTLAV